MQKLVEKLGPYAKAVVLVVALVAGLLAEAAGVDVGIDTATVWQALGATVLVFLVPNRDA